MRFGPLLRLLHSVRSRVAIFALAATLLPSLALGVLAYKRNADILQKKAHHEIDATASFVTREIDLWLKDRVYELRVVGSSYLIAENLTQLAAQRGSAADRQVATRMREYLRSVAKRFPWFTRLQVAVDERIIVSTDTAELPPLPGDWQNRIRENLAVISDLHASEEPASVTLTIAIPLRSGRDTTVATLLATVDTRNIEQTLARLAFSGGELYVVGPDGRRLLSSQQTPIPAAQATLRADLPIFTHQGTIHEYANYRGTAVIGKYQPVPDSSWGVLVEQERSIVFAQLDELLDTNLIVLAVLLVGVGIGAWWIGLTIVRPLDRLVAGANRVARGELDIVLPIDRNDELGYLTDRFNDMTAQLRGNRADLASANDKLIRKNIELEAISITDSLTSLYNRRHIMSVLDREFQQHARNGRMFTLLLADLDHFKRINDTHGHPAGDAVLIAAARVFREAIRGVDYAARFGGEEFVMLLMDTDREAALHTAERVRAQIAQTTVAFGGMTIPMSTSIGVAQVAAESGDTPSALIARADAALYEAKHLGRNRVCAFREEPQQLSPHSSA